MRTAVRDTSRDAYHSLKASPRLGAQQQRVLDYIASLGIGGATRSEISETIGMRLSSVCGRVNELIAVGELEDGPRRPCKITASTAHVVRRPESRLGLFE